ncbi:MAG TPA: TetR/AcrR family transcriptional regulator [Candidatus Sulfotelmatobacter sp.]|nr:TetR/AcrR family transcriptional regulator [Candidatus Sulfotelmatobacter sp.]
MDNASRSENTRNAVIQAALEIIARNGPGKLTLDAIARECGMSKGAVTHHFRTKQAVLKALLEHEIEYFKKFAEDYCRKNGGTQKNPNLLSQIATARETIRSDASPALAIFGAVAEEPGLLSVSRDLSAEIVEKLKAETDDPDLALLRWVAASGLAITAMFGMSPLSDADRERLFARLQDNSRWEGLASPGKSPETA